MDDEDADGGKPSSTFWELHQRLADCYVQDMALSPLSRPTKAREPAQGGLDTLSALRRIRSGRRTSTDVITERREVSISTLLDGKNRACTETHITLAPHPCWKQKKREHSASMNRAVSVDALMASGFTPGSKIQSPAKPLTLELPEGKGGGQARSCVLHPGGMRRTLWNMAVALGVLHDLIFVPMYVFDLPNTLFFRMMEWITQIFWNFDFLVSIVTGYYDAGVLVLDLKRAALHYARTWMLFDVLLIAMDWSIVWLDSLGSEQGDLLQWSRTISML
ncbi:CngA [Symbiodinium pilosum]|uniref:CngA protein n=1 Tax=Symbiodinium pilosum TaxID=2952 RepID=A0A812LTH1_SYMPI|nr:CngA [Symbiodinium pilosum]